jgi:glycosyltransferase involved in cell wall biosynthesis
MDTVKVLLASFNSWHMDHSAKAYEQCGALAGLYIANKNARGVSSDLYHRCWPFHLCMKPLYHTVPPLEWQQVQYRCFMGVFNHWFKKQTLPEFNVVQAIYWGAKAPFDIAEQCGALKVLDATNSYPTTYDGYERREMALWGKKVRPSAPAHIIEQVARDVERADVVLCPSIWVKDSMIANGVPLEKCFINPFGVNTEVFKERTELPDHPRFVCVGSICLRKGQQYLFQAFERVKKRYPDAELVCLGEILSDFKPLWKRWENLVTYPGSVSHQELAELYTQSTAFILPSTEEGFSRAIIEAMASGLPILATYESGSTTLVDDGVEGLIFQSRNVDAIEVAMIEMIENPARSLDLGRAAAQRGRKKNTWQDYGERNLQIFRTVLGEKKS